MPENQKIYADAGDPGLRFILPSPKSEIEGGLVRDKFEGHLGAIVGRGGSGKSMLALQLVTTLLARADREQETDRDHPHSAFYFTLEASPYELMRQVCQFSWGNERYKEKEDSLHRVSAHNRYSNGLYLISIPSPADNLNGIILKIRQTVASQFRQIRSLAAIVIDPMGAIDAGADLRTNLIELKELAETHRTFVFLLTEKHAFEKHTSIEHYSHSIIHLEHDPGQRQHRRLFIQKARGQSFRSGYHYFELQQPHRDETIEVKALVVENKDQPEEDPLLSNGVRVFPSIEAQSSYAHDLLSKSQVQARGRPAEVRPFFPDEEGEPLKPFLTHEQIEVGSAIFLMGPPGTFKEHLASQFAQAADGATIYVSFKAEREAIRAEISSQRSQQAKEVLNPQDKGTEQRLEPFEPVSFNPRKDLPKELQPLIYFFDARSPLLTPEEILFTVRNAITRPEEKVNVRRAVIWGLRRLYDFPNFREGRVIQFLEALVTLLKARQITSLLVDWPDKQTLSTVPIVDLCQYIFLTRVCYTPAEPARAEEVRTVEGLRKLWSGQLEPKQVALLRAQRTRQGVHHDQGAVFKRGRGAKGWQVDRFTVDKATENYVTSFEQLWLHYGKKWEEDLSLLS